MVAYREIYASFLRPLSFVPSNAAPFCRDIFVILWVPYIALRVLLLNIFFRNFSLIEFNANWPIVKLTIRSPVAHKHTENTEKHNLPLSHSFCLKAPPVVCFHKTYSHRSGYQALFACPYVLFFSDEGYLCGKIRSIRPPMANHSDDMIYYSIGCTGGEKKGAKLLWLIAD